MFRWKRIWEWLWDSQFFRQLLNGWEPGGKQYKQKQRNEKETEGTRGGGRKGKSISSTSVPVIYQLKPTHRIVCIKYQSTMSIHNLETVRGH